MKKLTQSMLAEFLKMKHTFIFPFHAAIPLLGSTVFLIYYRFSGWNERSQIIGYMEIIGVALPFVISVICAANIRLEEQNHFQIFLGSYVHKWNGLAIKCFVLSGMGFLSITGAVILFGIGYHFILGKEGVSVIMYVQFILALFFGSIPLYLEHLFLNLVFPGTVSMCAGVAQSMLSALFLTGLGDGKWQCFPCTWSARGIMLALDPLQSGNGNPFLIRLLLLFLICVIIGIWFHYYEGRQCND